MSAPLPVLALPPRGRGAVGRVARRPRWSAGSVGSGARCRCARRNARASRAVRPAARVGGVEVVQRLVVEEGLVGGGGGGGGGGSVAGAPFSSPDRRGDGQQQKKRKQEMQKLAAHHFLVWRSRSRSSQRFKIRNTVNLVFELFLLELLRSRIGF